MSEMFKVRINRTLIDEASKVAKEISMPFTEVPWLKWLTKATPKQRANWSLEPGGFAIYWPDLDDGIEVCHLLDSQPIA